ncbi:MAG: GNAT family N-acetyltransferase [Erysipelotrichia bacterium]|nr:GNAT family N-acetyltransferase [Erysipelotrichia bacterium]
MEYIKLTSDNLEEEHICCAISGNNDPQVSSKKAWLKERMKEGLVFLKADVRGKCFLEYIPAEHAWAPINAKGYLFIDCFWVSGSLKGHGYADDLLEQCIEDAKKQDRNGICVLSSVQKKPFLSDPQYLAHKGFKVADTADPFFALMYLPLKDEAPIPSFASQVRHPQIQKQGFVLYYTAGCPFTAKYVPSVQKAAEDAGIAFESIQIKSCKEAYMAPAAWTDYALFYNGAYVTNEIQNEKRFLSLAEKIMR